MICVYSCIHTIFLALALAPSCTIRPWTGLGQILGSRFRNCEKHWCLQGTNCNVATRWSIKLSILSLLLLWLNIYLSNSFNSSIHVFHSKIAIGLALHESCGVACATREKHWCLQRPVPKEGFPRQTCKNHLCRSQGCVFLVALAARHWFWEGSKSRSQ